MNWNSYKTILFAAIIIRMIAAIFSQGYGMHDDHFLIIEAASSWVDGYDYNNWLPWSEGNNGIPQGHSFTYVGLNYIYFYLAKGIGIVDPKILMLGNRILHGLFSVLIVFFGIKITERLSNRQNAIYVGWLLAIAWFMPFLSVRNLVEVACIPFIMWSIWLMIKSENWKPLLVAGLLMGMAVSFRYQVGVFALGVAAVLFFQKRVIQAFIYGFGVLITFGITQGIVDYMIWGKPFAEFISYSTYNMDEGTKYIPNDNYFMYFLVLVGAYILPLGILLLVGFFNSWKKVTLIFVPTLLFILFHSFYPSKQERFILPVLPFFVMLGVMGYYYLKDFRQKARLWRVSLFLFFIINTPALLFASVTYSKKSRVEAMYYFYEVQVNPFRILHEGTGDTGIPMLPKFYSGYWEFGGIRRDNVNTPKLIFEGYNYDYIIFYGEDNLAERISIYREIYPQLELVKVCEPSMVDRLLRWLNPRNTNEYIEVWKTNYDFEN